MMSSESMQTISDPFFLSKMPLFDGTLASAGLSKPPNMSASLSKQTLQYNGAYMAYEPRRREGAVFSPSWTNPKMTLHDGKSPQSHFSDMMAQNHLIYRQDSSSSEEDCLHSSSMHHNPPKPSIMLYAKSPEICTPSAAVSVEIRKPKSGCENSSSYPDSSVYLAIPKPVYRRSPCCNELGYVVAPQYCVKQGSPRIPNAVYEREWSHSEARFSEIPPIQRKTHDSLLQQKGFQFQVGADPLKRIAVEAYSPGRTRTLPSIIEPNYSPYSCTPPGTIFSSLSEHGQPLQTSPRGYNSLYPSHPTYEHMTSEVYQERSPMSKYGQLAQHPVFYYPQANVEVENRTQHKDSGSKQKEDAPVVRKRQIPSPQERCVVPQPHRAEIPLPLYSTEMLPAHSFLQGFDYPCYAVQRFHLQEGPMRSPLRRQHPSPSFLPSHVNVSPSSHHKGLPVPSLPSLLKDRPNTSSPFLHMDQSSPTRHASQPGISPPGIQMSHFFPPLAGLPINPAIPPPAGMNTNRLTDYSCEAQVACLPKSLPGSPAAWLSQLPHRSSDLFHKATPDRKASLSPVAAAGSKHDASVLSSEVHEQSLKRSRSHTSPPPITIKQEKKDWDEVEPAQKRQKMVKEENQSSSPPMPVIDNVFSLASYQAYLQATQRFVPSRAPQKTNRSSEQQEVKQVPEIKEKSPDRDKDPPVAPKEVSPTETSELSEPKDIKVEKDDPSDSGCSVETCVRDGDYKEVIIKNEPEETDSPDNEPMLLTKKCEFNELEIKPSVIGECGTSEEPKPSVVTAHVNSSSQGNAQAVLQSNPTPLPENKLVPPHCLKLSNVNIILPVGHPPQAAPTPETPTEPRAVLPKLQKKVPLRQHFIELHHSLCKLISKSVSATPEQELKDWLSKLEITESTSPSTKGQKVTCLLGEKAREVWVDEETKSALNGVLQRVREYTAQERCPFPHVIRAGAAFLPMLVVKELLFPAVQGGFVDQVLQEHRVELRPTTLSEEKILVQLHKRAFSSRLRRLMSLKHLPCVYADVVNLLHYTYVCQHLGVEMAPDYGEDCEAPLCPDFSGIPSDSETKNQNQRPQWKRNGKKSRVKSSSRRMFLDCSYSDEEDAITKESPGEDEYQQNEGTESSLTAQSLENSWMCPLSVNDIQSSETEDSPGLSCVDRASRSEKHPIRCRSPQGMILKLRRMLSGGLDRKRTLYQAVPTAGTLSALSQSYNDETLSNATRKVPHRWQRTGSFPHVGSSKRSRRLLQKIKYSPFLSVRHSAEGRRRWVLRSAVRSLYYPDLVGKNILHLYEEDDKSEVWYRGEVLRVHEAHSNPLKTIFEVRYDSEPEWKYYLELLVDYKKGWLKIQD